MSTTLEQLTRQTRHLAMAITNATSKEAAETLQHLQNNLVCLHTALADPAQGEVLAQQVMEGNRQLLAEALRIGATTMPKNVKDHLDA